MFGMGKKSAVSSIKRRRTGELLSVPFSRYAVRWSLYLCYRELSKTRLREVLFVCLSPTPFNRGSQGWWTLMFKNVTWGHRRRPESEENKIVRWIKWGDSFFINRNDRLPWENKISLSIPDSRSWLINRSKCVVNRTMTENQVRPSSALSKTNQVRENTQAMLRREPCSCMQSATPATCRGASVYEGNKRHWL